MKKWFTALCASLIAAVFLLGGTVSDAQANPTFVKWKWVKYSVQTDKRFPKNDYRHTVIRVVIRYTNVSNDKIVTAFFKKATSLTAWIDNKSPFSAYAASTKVNKVELYPGQSYDLAYFLPVTKAHWNADVLAGYVSRVKGIKLTKTKLQHSFNASAKPL